MTADVDDVLLIHGGLWEDAGADWFWRRTGVVDGLAGRGLTVVAPDRLRRAPSWTAEADQLTGRLVLAWPATLADQFTAIRVRAGLARQGAPTSVLSALLGAQTLPSATDAELSALAVPVGVVPAEPPGPVHPRSAVDALLRLLPSAVELPGSPEPPRPEFPAYLTSFVDAVTAFAPR
jgi:hypothetical protein